MTEDETKTSEPIRCKWCDAMTDTPGHAVKDGDVVQCPSISFIVTIDGQRR
jgi:hypothetical protein